MRGNRLQVLMVEDNQEFFQLIRKALALVEPDSCELTHTTNLSDAIERLKTGGFDAVVLDLSLPDSKGYDTFSQLTNHALDVPVVVLTANDNPETAMRAMRHGAQDYLVKGTVNGQLLLRSLRFAIERQASLRTLRRLSMIDDLTELYNRRGFLNLAEQHIKLAQRSNSWLALLMFDLDGMKTINDTYGHLEGDLALIRTAEVLRKTFRSTDLIARLGGDEFVVLAIDTPPESIGRILTRLQEHLNYSNRLSSVPYRLSFSSGYATFSGGEGIDLQGLVNIADQSMYEDKHERKKLLLKDEQPGAPAPAS